MAREDGRQYLTMVPDDEAPVVMYREADDGEDDDLMVADGPEPFCTVVPASGYF